MFKELIEAVEKPLVRAQADNLWVQSGTWSLVDKRTAIRKEGNLSQRKARRLSRKITTSLKEGSKKRTQKRGRPS